MNIMNNNNFVSLKEFYDLLVEIDKVKHGSAELGMDVK